MTAACKCPKCNGKGYVFNAESCFLTIALPVIWAMERMSDDDDGATRKTCPRCDGTGFIAVQVLR